MENTIRLYNRIVRSDICWPEVSSLPWRSQNFNINRAYNVNWARLEVLTDSSIMRVAFVILLAGVCALALAGPTAPQQHEKKIKICKYFSIITGALKIAYVYLKFPEVSLWIPFLDHLCTYVYLKFPEVSLWVPFFDHLCILDVRIVFVN